MLNRSLPPGAKALLDEARREVRRELGGNEDAALEKRKTETKRERAIR